MNKTNQIRKETLIKILVDLDALDADRDDAAMDLGEEFDDNFVLKALIQVSLNPKELDMILESCGEAIGKIWVKRNIFNEKIYYSLPKLVQDGIYCVIKSRKPIWIKKFSLN